MQITFKNVGQGDSIILEWSRNNEPRLGIVDCHIFQNTNPTVRHLQKVGCRKIDFIILSHPHDDHFSGMLELLEFCEKQDIPILRFMHSAAIHPQYLNFANINSSDQELLQKIFQKVKALYEKKLIRNAGYISQDTIIPLYDAFSIKVLSPSSPEVEKFIKTIGHYSDQSYAECSIAANLLSTVLLISNEKIGCLLTADAEKSTFKRLKDRHSDEFESLLMIGQIPHHGSKSNHYPPFWSNLKRTQNVVAAVSAGVNNKYGHPNSDVVSDFSTWGYETFSTNQFVNFTKPSQAKTSLILDTISKLIAESEQNDLTFEMLNDSVSTIWT